MPFTDLIAFYESAMQIREVEFDEASAAVAIGISKAISPRK